MSEIAIRSVELGKRYAIGERERYLALRDLLARAITAPARWFHSNGNGNGEDRRGHIWALRDVNFEIREGEVIGLVGRNGAGKTTLLKVLARVTNPSTGFAEVRGRMGTLLEVGTGFHPELTGRENVYLSGAILGMSRREMDSKFDEMVDFAGLEKFIDTPLKHYSTGMQMRLAFGVAAQLEPDILLVDEVLAVGDAAFQKKCLGKMSEVAQGGRTIIFVSHQMTQVRRLCQRVLWVDQGSIRVDGPVGEVVAAYESSQLDPLELKGSQCFVAWKIVEPDDSAPHCLNTHGPLKIKLSVHLQKEMRDGHHFIGLYNSDQLLMWGSCVDNLRLPAGDHQFIHCLSSLPLRPGAYRWRVSLFEDAKMLDSWEGVPELVVATQPLGHRLDQWSGLLNIPWQFTIEQGEAP